MVGADHCVERGLVVLVTVVDELELLPWVDGAVAFCGGGSSWCVGARGGHTWSDRYSSVPRACHYSVQSGVDRHVLPCT